MADALKTNDRTTPEFTRPPAGHQLAVVLVEPQIPQNAGNIARLCACTATELFVVGQLGFRLSDRQFERAGLDYWQDVSWQHVADFKDVLAQKPGWTPYFLSTKAKQTYTAIAYPTKSLLVFGSETHGLPAWLIDQYAANSLRIPMLEGQRSLNLSNSVSIVLYEAMRQLAGSAQLAGSGGNQTS
ncbi:MAG: tRNA (cytidine(34)-2'-O)-methyltransferase [Vampirovibrionales bacterium]|nr:tRNA (cytidine(34)-2'-O)-methyltransferase [Vampirovibrionales bacterium]